MKNSTKVKGRKAQSSRNFLSILTKGIDIPGASNINDNPLKEGVETMTLRDVVYHCKNGRMKGYKHNRGVGRIVPRTIENIADNLKPHALGLLTVSEDGTVVDGHNRFGGVCLRAQTGKMTKEDWKSIVPIRIVKDEQFIETYKYLGDVQAHSINDHLSNPELLLGKCITGKRGIFDQLSKIGCTEEEIQIIRSVGSLTIIGNVLTALHLENGGILPESIGEINSYCEVYKVRHIMKNMAKSMTDEECYLVHPEDYKKVAEACRYYAQFKLGLRDAKARDEGLPSITKLNSNKGLMGFIISDIVFNDERKLTNLKPETLAKRLLVRAKSVEKRLADILGSNNKNAKTAYNYILKQAKKPV